MKKGTSKLISEIGINERFIRSGHYNSIKVWWARRPIISMRSILLNELNERNDFKYDIDSSMFTDINPSINNFNKVKEDFNTNNLTTLDLFSGGGSIPFESSRLGFKTYSSELSPVACLLQETIFNSLPIKNYPSLLKKSGEDVIKRIKNRVGHYYNLNGVEPYVIFWSKISKCKNCSSELDLRRLTYLSKKKKKTITIKDIDSSFDIDLNGKGRKDFVCENCGEINKYSDIKQFCKTNKLGSRPLLICTHVDKKKTYLPISNFKTKIDELNLLVEDDLKKLIHLIPVEKVITKSGVINPTIYDLKEPKDFFNKRQLLVLLTLMDEIKNQFHDDSEIYGEKISKQILLGLTSLIEFQIDWNSKSSMWISQNEQTGRSLAGPGVGMKWDYIEINPFYNSGSNFKSKLKRVVETFESINSISRVEILQGSSDNIKLKENSVDIILTDPPYYDSIDYTGLSDFFRPWFESLIRVTYDKNVDLKTDSNLEAIVELSNSKKKSGKDEKHYLKMMTNIITEGKRVLKDDGTFFLLYSHKTFEGWKVISKSITDAGLYISKCDIYSMERLARPRGMNFQVLDGVVVFKMKKNNINISRIEDDILEIPTLTELGELNPSQLVLYLASLSCKYSNLNNVSFDESYEKVIQLFESNRIEGFDEKIIDEITRIYLLSRLNQKLDKNQISVLEHQKIYSNGKILNMEELVDNKFITNTILGKSINLYEKFQFESLTKIQIEQNDFKSIQNFFSIIGGLRLNTVSKRSSSKEEKIVRTILSKISEVETS
jgi:adenine-specific DNA methylase